MTALRCTGACHFIVASLLTLVKARRSSIWALETSAKREMTVAVIVSRSHDGTACMGSQKTEHELLRKGMWREAGWGLREH